MKKLAIVAAVAGALAMPAPSALAQQSINVLTGGTSGIYYPLGVALGKIYGDKIPNVKTQVQATKASVENLILLEQGKGEIALTLGDSLKAAWEGDEEAGFKAKLGKLRAIGAVYPSYIHWSRPGTAASRRHRPEGQQALGRRAEIRHRTQHPRDLEAAGMSYADVRKVEYLPFAELVDLMKNRQLDATLQSAGLGVASCGTFRTRWTYAGLGAQGDRPKDGTAVHAGDNSGKHLQGAGQLRRDGRRCELSRHPFRRARTNSSTR